MRGFGNFISNQMHIYTSKILLYLSFWSFFFSLLSEWEGEAGVRIREKILSN